MKVFCKKPINTLKCCILWMNIYLFIQQTLYLASFKSQTERVMG